MASNNTLRSYSIIPCFIFVELVIMSGTVLLAYYMECTDLFSVHMQGFFCNDAELMKPYPGTEESSFIPPLILYCVVAAAPTAVIFVGEVSMYVMKSTREALLAQEKTIVTGDCCYLNPLVRRIVRFVEFTLVEHEYIFYIHDGSNTLRDNFTITANQTEIRKHSLPCTAHIYVTPVDDETPVVTTNKGLKVWEGSVTEITTDDLSAEDSDTPESEQLEFVVTPPSNGHLALKSAPSRHILNFTQNHIQTGQLMFVHSGALSGGFHFQVNDGVNVAPRQIFSTAAHSLVLTLKRNHPLQVSPGSVTQVSELELQAVTNDIRDTRRSHSVVFAVTALPKLGSLVRRMPDNSTQNISTFTQSMVNEGVILYDQNKPQPVGWSAGDSFSFTVSSPPALLPPHTFTISISQQPNKHPESLYNTRLLNNAGAVVAEGGRVKIDRSKLDASNLLWKVPEPQRKENQILYRLTSLPRHGALSIKGHNLTRNHPYFSQVTLNKFGITYVHDNSETTSDSFTLRAWERAAVTETFNITVTSVNDQPPAIMSTAPSVKVVVGERVTIGPEDLQ
ncbi:hypothetical protein JOQ06_008388, partial [Pogonophryne albipinna]